MCIIERNYIYTYRVASRGRHRDTSRTSKERYNDAASILRYDPFLNPALSVQMCAYARIPRVHYTRAHGSRIYYTHVRWDVNSMQPRVCATIKNIAADLFSVFLSADENIRGAPRMAQLIARNIADK